MGNTATTFNEQIALLEKRGMVIDLEPNKVKEILLDIGYYRLGFYWHPFVIDECHNLAKGTRFSDVVCLYYLDVDLRNILNKYINRVEISFRTQIIYYVSNKYKNSPTWFIDSNVLKNDFIKDIDKYYNENFKISNKPIKKHHQKYLNDKYAPAWKTLEFFSFGVILKIFKNLKNEEIKKRISNNFGMLNVQKFTNFIDTIVLLRNNCAHSDVLFDFKTPLGISSIPEINYNNRDRHSLDSTIRVLIFILGKISINRKNELIEEIESKFEEHKNNSIIKKIIETKINYSFEKSYKKV
ncbi:Abi family protein [Cloacibacterium normanense]|uniref:Abi family protein n=1 Tax=Cloacibacterium normanense TaxID=237258 RepID=UPI00391D5F10